jgi:nucleotide-binding universal stress UspA family protein
VPIPAAIRPHVGTVLEYGTPQHLLAEYAAEQGVDLVVVGTRGRGALSAMLLGSVAGEILAAVPCDILVVREPPDEGEAPSPERNAADGPFSAPD